jgi:hypothetical protein
MVLYSEFVNKKYGTVIEEQSFIKKVDGSNLNFSVFVIFVKCFLLFYI